MIDDLNCIDVSSVVIFYKVTFSLLQIVQEYERAVIFRLGRVLPGARGPGMYLQSATFPLEISYDTRYESPLYHFYSIRGICSLIRI